MKWSWIYFFIYLTLYVVCKQELLHCRNYSTRKFSGKKQKETMSQYSFLDLSRISNSSRSQFKKITIFTQILYFVLLETYRNQIFLYFHFELKNNKVSKDKNFAHFSLIRDGVLKWSIIQFSYTIHINICVTMISSIM